MCTIDNLYDLSHTLAANYLQGFTYPWEALKGIKETILSLGAALPEEEYDRPQSDVWIHKTAKIAPTAYIAGPCIIGPESEVRHCAFIRGSALVGVKCVVGNSTELKNVILFDGVQVPHFNYVGDSILGYKATWEPALSHPMSGATRPWSPSMPSPPLPPASRRWALCWVTLLRSAVTASSIPVLSSVGTPRCIPLPALAALYPPTASIRQTEPLSSRRSEIYGKIFRN